MATDASIYGAIRPFQAVDPLAQYAQIEQLQGARQRNRLAELTLADKQRETAGTEAVNAAYGQAFDPATGKTDNNKLLQALATSGQGSRIPTVQKAIAEQQKALTDADSSKLKLTGEKLGLAAQFLGGVKDQASYDQARQAAQANGLDVSTMPPQYDPAMVQQRLQQALTAKEQLEQFWKGKNFQLETDKFGETKRNNQVQNGISAGNLSVSQQGLQLRKQELAQGKVPPGYRQNADGTMSAIPGGPADLKVNAGQTQKVTDAKDVLSLLDQANGLIDKSTSSYLGAGVDQVGRAVGYASGGAEAAAQLRALEGALVSKMPKMSGPQSDKDVLLYKQMAGQIGDPTIPASQKKAAMSTIREINERAISGVGGASGSFDSPKPTGPKAGTVQDGYRFKGGNPADPSSWVKQ